MSLYWIVFFLIINISIICLLLSFFLKNNVESKLPRKTQKELAQERLDTVVATEGHYSYNSERIYRSFQKWYIPNESVLKVIINIFHNNRELSLSNFTLQNLGTPNLYIDSMKWYRPTWIGAIKFSDCDVHHAIQIDFDRRLKTYSLICQDYILRYKIIVSDFETKQQLESFIQKSYWIFKEWKQILDNKEQDKLNQAFNELP